MKPYCFVAMANRNHKHSFVKANAHPSSFLFPISINAVTPMIDKMYGIMNAPLLLVCLFLGHHRGANDICPTAGLLCVKRFWFDWG